MRLHSVSFRDMLGYAEREIRAFCASEIFAVAKVKCCHAAALEVLLGRSQGKLKKAPLCKGSSAEGGEGLS
ncbi:MAG: hypothetical protein IKT72_00015, partial [Clostridia bacterium]|nr:hypothetical protein [Clostridia bacterium]